MNEPTETSPRCICGHSESQHYESELRMLECGLCKCRDYDDRDDPQHYLTETEALPL